MSEMADQNTTPSQSSSSSSSSQNASDQDSNGQDSEGHSSQSSNPGQKGESSQQTGQGGEGQGQKGSNGQGKGKGKGQGDGNSQDGSGNSNPKSGGSSDGGGSSPLTYGDSTLIPVVNMRALEGVPQVDWENSIAFGSAPGEVGEVQTVPVSTDGTVQSNVGIPIGQIQIPPQHRQVVQDFYAVDKDSSQ